MTDSRINALEEVLDCKIIEAVTKGQSLEKYHAVYKDQHVLLRIYNDEYYSNRFLREGMILRQLQPDSNIAAPKIVEEWPEHQIRAIQWYDFNDRKITTSDVDQIIQWIQSQKMNIPYNLHEDLAPHLSRVGNIHSAYVNFYLEHLSNVFDLHDWAEGDDVLIHGDLHSMNIGYYGDQLIVYDWEYGTIGSEYFDPAYYSVSQEVISDSIPMTWQYLTALVNCHWYLQEDTFSPKEAIDWVNLVGDIHKRIL